MESQVTPAPSMVTPALAEVQAIMDATVDVGHKLHLAAVRRALKVVAEGGADATRVGREAAAVVIAQVEAVDSELDGMQRRGKEGFLTGALVRRHMLLTSRRQRLVGLAVLLEDLALAAQAG